MSRKDSEKIIDEASPHTVKKFELVTGYIKSWKEILLLQPSCEELIFIDCMSSSGEYIDSKTGEKIYGTPVRADKLLREAASKYTRKNISVIFNDKSAGKIDYLKTLIPEGSGNYHVSFYNEDCNTLLRELRHEICGVNGKHYLLFYDPYQAIIDWDALMPYFNHWGEVIINHMLSDSIRAAREAKSPEAVSKYESTYGTKIMRLAEWGSDKQKYESCVEDIIRSLRMHKSRDYFIASFPFFNVNNALLYDIIHCTGHIKGFELFKTTAWQVFGGQSSNKRPLKSEAGQGVFAFPDDNNDSADESCYTVEDIAHYIHGKFKGRKNVPTDEVWSLLDFHPVFPSKGFKRRITKRLKEIYGDKTSGKTISFEA